MFITFPNDPGCQLGSFKADLTTGKEKKLYCINVYFLKVLVTANVNEQPLQNCQISNVRPNGSTCMFVRKCFETPSILG